MARSETPGRDHIDGYPQQGLQISCVEKKGKQDSKWAYVESSQTLARLENPWSGGYFVGSGRAARWLKSRR
jgi:hypothetical protein